METEGYDVIGDVHGSADKLGALLGELGYRRADSSGAYRHPVRHAVFVGDLIDRGCEQAATLEIVKDMVDAGAASVVMGNHEFNALCYATTCPDGSGSYLREHSKKNKTQHEAFLKLSAQEQDRYREWFFTWPLWLDLGGLRVIHACWHAQTLETARSELGGDRFTSVDQLVNASKKGTGKEKGSPLYEAVEVLLKGPEIPLATFGGGPFRDKDGQLRDAARVKWWDEFATRLPEAVVMPSSATTTDGEKYIIPDRSVDNLDLYLYTDKIPVVYGHYWREGRPAHREDWTAHTACIDFSAVLGGPLVAYRWSGETEIDPHHYHPYGPDVVLEVPST
jgi:hypothetical protein